MKTVLLFLLFTSLIHSQQQVDIPWQTLANSPWPMIAHDPQITGRSPYSGPKTPTIKWTLDLPYGVYSGPIIGEDGTLYVGTNAYLYFMGDTTNYFYAIDPDNGRIIWTFLTGTPFANESGYLINNEGTIFFGSQSGWLYAIDTKGNLKWKYDTGGNIHQRVMNTDLQGNIYIANSTGYLFSFSKEGRLNWKANYGGGLFPRSVSFSPDGNTIYTTGKGSNLYALNLDGSLKWYLECPGDRRLPLLIDNNGNIIFLAGCTPPWSLTSIDSLGTLNWEYVINNNNANFTESSPAMDYEGNIYYTYVADSAGVVWYSRLESVDYYGNYRWTYQFDQPEEVIVMPLICDKDGTVYCGSTFGYNYYAVSKDGELLWQIPLEGYYVENSTAIASDGTLYIGKCLYSTFTQGVKTLIAIQDTGSTSVSQSSIEASDYSLSQNYPNPFNATTHIKYSIPQSGKVKLTVYNLMGSEVARILDIYQGAGSYDVTFQPKDLASGIYFYTLTSGNFTTTKKLILLK